MIRFILPLILLLAATASAADRGCVSCWASPTERRTNMERRSTTARASAYHRRVEPWRV